MSEIKEKVENELKTVKSLCETMENAIKTQIDKGLDKVNTHELYEAVDIYKDLSEVKKNIVEICYKKQIMEAMENADYGEDYDENGEIERKYYNNYRYANGRYAPKGRGRRMYTEPIMYDNMYPMEYYRDMDKWNDNRMYYTHSNSNMSGMNDNSDKTYQNGYNDGQSRGYSEGYNRGRAEGSNSNNQSRVERARRGYEEIQHSTSNTSQTDKDMRVKELNTYMDELTDDLKNMISRMSNEEKTMLKSKIAKLGTLV